MKNFGRFVASTMAAALMAVTAFAPAHAIVDQNGNVVAAIITADGKIYY